MNKDKLKHLPINLLSNLSTFGIVFGITILTTDNILLSIVISFAVYLHSVRVDASLDYLEEQINKKAQESNTIDLEAYSLGVEEGIKWTQERMYSEEEVNDIIFRLFEDYASNYTNEALKDFHEIL